MLKNIPKKSSLTPYYFSLFLRFHTQLYELLNNIISGNIERITVLEVEYFNKNLLLPMSIVYRNRAQQMFSIKPQLVLSQAGKFSLDRGAPLKITPLPSRPPVQNNLTPFINKGTAIVDSSEFPPRDSQQSKKGLLRPDQPVAGQYSQDDVFSFDPLANLGPPPPYPNYLGYR